MDSVVLPRGVRRPRPPVRWSRRWRVRSSAFSAEQDESRQARGGVPVTSSGPVLVAGASGFVGRRLCSALTAAGHDVRAMTRSPDSYVGDGEPVHGDVHDVASLQKALHGSRAAYYLVHSLDSKDFERLDAEAARAFGEAAAGAGVEQIIYLGGLGSDERPAVLAPEQSTRGRRPPRCRRRSGHRPASGHHRRCRRHLLGDDAAAGRPPSRYGHAAVGADQDTADRRGRRRSLSGRGSGRATSDWPGVRHRRP